MTRILILEKTGDNQGILIKEIYSNLETVRMTSNKGLLKHSFVYINSFYVYLKYFTLFLILGTVLFLVFLLIVYY